MTCQRTIWDGWRHHPCGKPVPDGQTICRFHASVDSRREAKADEHKKKYREEDELEKRLKAEAAEFSKNLGVAVTPEYCRGYTGKFVVSGEDLTKLDTDGLPR
jgi:hypothetical protein